VIYTRKTLSYSNSVCTIGFGEKLLAAQVRRVDAFSVAGVGTV
jgi:hypothetical protein